MTLSDRKKKILYSLVDDYIVTAEPVSSKKIQEEHLPDYSSATIRNELSALESMGYLVQPHTSAGRVPSQKAFRFYVDQLMVTPLTQDEISAIEGHFTDKVSSCCDGYFCIISLYCERILCSSVKLQKS